MQNRSTNNVGQAMQGKVSGVQIMNMSSAPGADPTFRIRGYSSNSANSDPLYIVDGLKVKSINYLDPSSIESVEVLKDAASAAIYGAEAGNGVVLVTTRQGSITKSRFFFYKLRLHKKLPYWIHPQNQEYVSFSSLFQTLHPASQCLLPEMKWPDSLPPANKM